MSQHWKFMVAAGALLLATQAISPTASAQEKKKGLVDQMSGQGYGMAGCGLGSILFGDKPGMVQIFASTTNNTYGNNTFGVSSGTSNCETDDGDAKSAKVFIESNRFAIENDIARGSGETLSAFFDIAGCEERANVGQALQKNYQGIFAKDAGSERNPEQVLNSIRETIRANKPTATACPNLG